MIGYFLSRILTYCSVKPVLHSQIDKKAKLVGKVEFINSKIGRYSYVGPNSSVLDTDIGSFCSISENVVIGGGSHPLNTVSTSPVFCKGRNALCKNFAKYEFEPYKRTHIENDVWIGSNVIVKSGITIGNGSVIGMGSVVTKNVGPYEIWAGNPAHFIRKRFDDDIIAKLLTSHWWELEETRLQSLAKYITDVEKFAEIVGEENK